MSQGLTVIYKVKKIYKKEKLFLNLSFFQLYIYD